MARNQPPPRNKAANPELIHMLRRLTAQADGVDF